jgi:hypothetical protein
MAGSVRFIAELSGKIPSHSSLSVVPDSIVYQQLHSTFDTAPVHNYSFVNNCTASSKF